MVPPKHSPARKRSASRKSWRAAAWLLVLVLIPAVALISCGEQDQLADLQQPGDVANDGLDIMAMAGSFCNLPTDPVDATHAHPGATSFFNITLSDVGDGFDVTDGTYPGWCIEDNFRDNTLDPVTLFCSLDASLPGNLGDAPWDQVNYLLNHKAGTPDEVQSAVWILTWGSSDTFSPTLAALAMVADAQANGDGFVPGAGEIVAVILYTGDGGLGPKYVQDSIIEVPVDEEEPGECRVTGGGVDTFGDWDGETYAKGKDHNGRQVNRYQFGGQAGAPTASQPQPWGEWTHHQQRGPDGSFIFHAGTASAPEGTEIDLITCSDPGWCAQARPAPNKQIDFEGVGTFKNIKNASAALSGVVAGETRHWFEVHIEDLGEPGKSGKQDPPGSQCPEAGSAGDLADCDCPDFYQITIHETEDPASAIIYEVLGYVTGGNLQIHPAIK